MYICMMYVCMYVVCPVVSIYTLYLKYCNKVDYILTERNSVTLKIFLDSEI